MRSVFFDISVLWSIPCNSSAEGTCLDKGGVVWKYHLLCPMELTVAPSGGVILFCHKVKGMPSFEQLSGLRIDTGG